MKKWIKILPFAGFIFFGHPYELFVYRRTVKQNSDVKVVSRAFVNPNVHNMHNKYSIFYKNDRLCSNIARIFPQWFFLSPDRKYLLYLRKEGDAVGDKESYVLYNTENKTKEIFQADKRLIPLINRIEWSEDTITLYGDLQNQVLNLKTGTMEIIDKEEPVPTPDSNRPTPVGC